MKVQHGIRDKDNDYGGRFIVMIDGKERLAIGGGEPEDMILTRDLSSILRVPKMLQEAHAAGVKGESFEILELPPSEDDL